MNFLRFSYIIHLHACGIKCWQRLGHVLYIGIRCYVKDWMKERGYY